MFVLKYSAFNGLHQPSPIGDEVAMSVLLEAASKKNPSPTAAARVNGFTLEGLGRRPLGILRFWVHLGMGREGSVVQCGCAHHRNVIETPYGWSTEF